MQTGLKVSDGQFNIHELRTEDRRSLKANYRILIAASVLLFVVSMCVRTTAVGLMNPVETFHNLIVWIHLKCSQLVNGPYYFHRFAIVEGLPTLTDTVQRLFLTVITFLCGALLALSGSIFQTVFRNPIAAPTMLGVATGVKVGFLMLVLQYESAAYVMTKQKYEYCYACAVGMLALVLIMGKISSGRKKFSVFDLLIVGALLSQIVGAVIQHYVYSMDNDLALVYQQVSGALIVNTDATSFAALGSVTLITVIPMFLMRFSFNGLGFDNDESRSLGINTGAMKIITLIIGSMMITAAMVHCGSVGMISLIVPFISRSIFGADYQDSFWSNILIGGGLMVLCRDIISLIPFGDYGLPIGTVVDFIALPVFVVIVAAGRRTWE